MHELARVLRCHPLSSENRLCFHTRISTRRNREISVWQVNCAGGEGGSRTEELKIACNQEQKIEDDGM